MIFIAFPLWIFIGVCTAIWRVFSFLATGTTGRERIIRRELGLSERPQKPWVWTKEDQAEYSARILKQIRRGRGRDTNRPFPHGESR